MSSTLAPVLSVLVLSVWLAGCGSCGEQRQPPPSSNGGSDFGNARVSTGRLEGLGYLEVVLGEAPAGEPIPLVIALHGLGDRPRLPYPPYEGLPTPLRVIAPRAPKPHGSGFAWFEVRVQDGETQRLADALYARTKQLAAFVERVTERYPTRGKPIVTGFSQGGMLTYALAVHHPESVGRAFPLSGWLPPPMVPDQRELGPPRPAIDAMHGGADQVIPLGPTRTFVDGLRERGYDIELRTFDDTGHEMTPEMNRLMKEWLRDALTDTRS